MKLPSMEFSFDINLKGTNTQEVFKGDFIYRRLSIGDQGKADVLRTRLNGDLANVDLEVDKLHEMLSWLRFGIISYPDWWRNSNFGADLYDANILKEIYDRVVSFEKKWTEEVMGNGSTKKDSNN